MNLLLDDVDLFTYSFSPASIIQVTVDHIDLGPVDKGVPIDDHCVFRRPAYPHALLRYGNNLPDTVLVNGCFRVACTMAALLYAVDDVVVIFHGFDATEAHKEVFKVTEQVATVGSLTVLKRKSGVSREKLKRLLHKYWFTPNA
jgi:hypothetical protein